ncbi:hypothetical protein HZS61_016895 [Fusarium oxysporum f. sp. conglutinans]|uniref:CCHC-type domain-containing protein n=2 Tax=Fusarium oxysporum f. sp. conglutinans TaxID=100902 RepID=A0A8H6GLR1_FUSOX|nr:hypothetical protein HZS61_016895 [Fusarium oxysporum f. sp. conglutinans]
MTSLANCTDTFHLLDAGRVVSREIVLVANLTEDEGSYTMTSNHTGWSRIQTSNRNWFNNSAKSDRAVVDYRVNGQGEIQIQWARLGPWDNSASEDSRSSESEPVARRLTYNMHYAVAEIQRFVSGGDCSRLAERYSDDINSGSLTIFSNNYTAPEIKSTAIVHFRSWVDAAINSEETSVFEGVSVFVRAMMTAAVYSVMDDYKYPVIGVVPSGMQPFGPEDTFWADWNYYGDIEYPYYAGFRISEATAPTNWTPNAMPAHPTPPAIPGSRAEYEACYAEDPDKWYQYLSDAYAWMKEQESNQVAADRKLVELQVQVETQQEEILNLQNTLQAVQIEKSAAMMQRSWVEDRLDKKEKELEAARDEARQAIASRLPTVSALTPSATPDPLAKTQAAEIVGAAPPPTTRSTASAYLSERLPDPEKFEATRADLRRFRDAITEKLTVNEDRYPTAVSRMAYVNSRLNKESYKLIQPYIFKGACRLPDYQDILDILQGAYGDPNEARTARRKLDVIKQRDRDFSTFYAEFQSLSLDSGLEGDALAPFLEKAVSKELSEMLLNNPPADYSYNTLVSHFKELDIRLQEYREKSRPYIPKRSNPIPRVGPTRTRAERQERKSPSPRSGRSPPENPQLAGDPMDLSNQRRYIRPNYRRENNQCFRCGSSSHYLRDCPEPDTRPAKFRHAAIPQSPYRYSRHSSPRSPASDRSDSRNSRRHQENGASLS